MAFGSNDSDDPPNALRALVANIHSNLRVARIERTFVVEITYVSDNAATAKSVSQAFAEIYIEDSLSAAKNSAKIGSGWLAERLNELRAQARSTDSAIESLRANGDRADPVTLNDLESQAQVARLAYESFLRKFTDVVQQQSFPISVARIVSDASIPTPVGPGRLVLFFLAVLAATALALGCAAIFESLSAGRYAGVLKHAAV
jgi:uncharacterized protein involved in exopolysaccharide biosynthesis